MFIHSFIHLCLFIYSFLVTHSLQECLPRCFLGRGPISDESCEIVALIHDLGKVGMPGNPQYIKNEPTARQKQYGYGASVPYSFNNNLTYLSVPVRSLYLALPYISLSEEEVQAIIYHDGQYVDDNKSVATKECPLLLLLQFADTWSAFVTEK